MLTFDASWEHRLYALARSGDLRGFWFEHRGDEVSGEVPLPGRRGQHLSKEHCPVDVHGHISMKTRVGERPLPAPRPSSRLAGWTRTPPLVACCPASQDRPRCASSRAAWLNGSGDDGEDLPNTDFGESLDLEQPAARATGQPLTPTGEF
ncbi:uncharacterized protein [Dermacentor albipictus]|uniref:uncharacterized protein n=1 Tax=Dermacentor albipictus TaxID=60249 RepID=UPI0038FD032A